MSYMITAMYVNVLAAVYQIYSARTKYITMVISITKLSWQKYRLKLHI